MRGSPTASKLAATLAYLRSRGAMEGLEIPRPVFDGVLMAGFGIGLAAARNLVQAGASLRRWDLVSRSHEAGQAGSRPGYVRLRTLT